MNSFLAIRNEVESVSQFKSYKNAWTSAHPKLQSKMNNIKNSIFSIWLDESASFCLKNLILAMRIGVRSVSLIKNYNNPVLNVWTSAHPKLQSKMANIKKWTIKESRTRICIFLREEIVSSDAKWCTIYCPIQKLQKPINKCASETSGQSSKHLKFKYKRFEDTNLHLLASWIPFWPCGMV